jgi:hypothetical protein
VSRLLANLRWTRKKVFHVEQSNKNREERQLEFLQNIAGLHDWISIDETSIALNMAPLYGYSPKGRRLSVSRKAAPRFQRFSLLMAVTRSEVVAYQWIDGSFKTESFCDFLRSIPHKFHGYPVLMDNVAFHRTQKVNPSRAEVDADLHPSLLAAI